MASGGPWSMTTGRGLRHIIMTMTRIIQTTTIDGMQDAGLLTLVQWLSPAFPVGSYAYSQGLEWVIAQGEIGSAGDLHGWLADMLEQGAGRNDAIILSLALREDADLAHLAALACALAPGPERLAESLAQGAAFVATTNALTGADLADLPYPVAVGAAARGLGLPPERVIAVFLQAQVQALVQAAVRFVPLGQTEGQGVLAALTPLILRLAAQAAVAGPGDLGGAALRADMATMWHETMETRIFRT